MGRAEIRALIRPVPASIRIRRPSNWVAHTEPAPTARSHPSAGRRVGVPTSRFEPGSMRETVHGAAGEHGIGPRLRTQTDPAPAATLKGRGTGMCTPTEGGPPGVVARGWPVHPTGSAARSTTATSRRQPRSQLLPDSRCPGSTRRRRPSVGQPGGGSIPSSRREDDSPGYTASPREVPARPGGGAAHARTYSSACPVPSGCSRLANSEAAQARVAAQWLAGGTATGR
jgi:hypothetical protein